jgi:hypothetical protein
MIFSSIDDPDDSFWQTPEWKHCFKARHMVSIAALRTNRVPVAFDAACESYKLIKPGTTRGPLFLERAVAGTQLFAISALTSVADAAMHTGHTAEAILRYLHSIRPDRIHLHLARFLHVAANFHSSHHRPKLAFAASKECIETYQKVPFMFERHGLTLAHALSDHARFAADLSLWDVSIATEKTVLGYLLAMNEQDHGAHNSRIIRSLMQLREWLRMTGDKAATLERSRELETFVRTHERLGGGEVGPELLGDACHQHGVDAASLELWDETIAALRESLAIHEERDAIVALGNDYLCISLGYLATGEHQAAIRSSWEAVQCTRIAMDRFAIPPTQLLISTLSNYAWMVFIVAPDVVETMRAEEEAAGLCEEMLMEENEEAARLSLTITILSSQFVHQRCSDDSQGSVVQSYLDRAIEICSRAARSLPNLRQALEDNLFSRFRRYIIQLEDVGRASDANAVRLVLSNVELILTDVDISSLVARVEREQLVKRILDRDKRTQSADPEEANWILATTTMEDGSTGFGYGKLHDTVLPRF